MNLSELPQTIIDRFFECQGKSHNIKSSWAKKFKLIQSSSSPYFRIIIKDDNYVYKIFYDENILETFNTAVEKNFFNDIALIENFIEYDNQKIGYVTRIFDMVGGFKMYKTINRISKLKYQPKEFIELYHLICRNVIQTRIAYVDIYPTNIVKYQNKFYIIDLDSLINLDKTNETIINNGYGTLPTYYIKFIKSLI